MESDMGRYGAVRHSQTVSARKAERRRMKNAVFWDVAPCRSCVNLHFGGTYRLHLQDRKIRKRGTSVSRLQPPAHAGSSLADFSILKMEAIYFEMSVHTRSTRRDIPEDGTLHIHRRENLKSYTERRSFGDT
jgi:hypothetical protein